MKEKQKMTDEIIAAFKDEPKSIDWQALREKFFAECVDRDLLCGGDIDKDPDFILEWFKNQISKTV